MNKFAFGRARPIWVLALLVFVLVGALTIRWPWMSPERFTQQLRLSHNDNDKVQLRQPRYAWISTTISNYWDVEPLAQPNGTVRIRVVLLELKSEHPWLLHRNRLLGPRLKVEGLRIQINPRVDIPRDDWERALKRPETISDTDWPNIYRAAARLHATGEPFRVTAIPESTWVGKGSRGFTVWVGLRTTKVQ